MSFNSVSGVCHWGENSRIFTDITLRWHKNKVAGVSNLDVQIKNDLDIWSALNTLRCWTEGEAVFIATWTPEKLNQSQDEGDDGNARRPGTVRSVWRNPSHNAIYQPESREQSAGELLAAVNATKTVVLISPRSPLPSEVSSDDAHSKNMQNGNHQPEGKRLDADKEVERTSIGVQPTNFERPSASMKRRRVNSPEATNGRLPSTAVQSLGDN